MAITASIAAPTKDEIVAQEKAIWKAFNDRNVDQVKKLISTDVLAVYPDGIYNFQQRLDGMSKMTMKSFSLSDFNVSMPSGDVAVISYKAKLGNKDGSSAELNCGTVWNLKNGEWKAVFHSDMKAER
jgi:ketosteroid isomerase-like protein